MIRCHKNKLLRFSREDIDKNAFELDYCHQTRPSSDPKPYDFRGHRVVMLRHKPDRMLGETDDSFTLHDAETLEHLGYGDTKDDASGAARYELMKRSERQYENGAAT
jgi:hypothetical protein